LGNIYYNNNKKLQSEDIITRYRDNDQKKIKNGYI
jgi:hypothetical protein